MQGSGTSAIYKRYHPYIWRKQQHTIDDNTCQKINTLAEQYNSTVDISYFDTVNEHDYFNITIMYPVKSGIFNIQKDCTYNSIVSVRGESL